MNSAQRLQYITRIERLAGPLSENERARIARVPDWAMPIWIRAGVRLLNDMPYAKVQHLALKEADQARPNVPT